MRWLVLILLAFAPPAAQPASWLDQQAVDRLVEQLGLPSRRDREQAEETLTSASSEVLDLLPRSARDPSVAMALQRIRLALEQSAARRAGLASTISLAGQRSPQEIESAILKQARQAVLFGETRPPAPMVVDWKDVPFWDVIRQLELKTRSTARPDRFAEALILRPRGDAPAPVVGTSGPCRVEVISASPRANLVDPSMSLLQVRWRVRAEPRLQPLYLITADRDCSLTNGSASFTPLSPDARREIPCERWEGCEVDTAFQVPAIPGKSRLQFSVDAKLKVAALPLKLRFDDLQQPSPAPQRRGGVTGVVSGVRSDSPTRTLALDIAVAYEKGGPEFESHRMWIYQNAGWLEQKSGNRIVPPDHVELKEIGLTGATLRYEFENVPAGLSEMAFVYEAPSLVIDVPVSVKGLELSVGK